MALREAKRRGHKALAIVNVVGSTIARESNGGIYMHRWPEIGVASTKAFISIADHPRAARRSLGPDADVVRRSRVGNSQGARSRAETDRGVAPAERSHQNLR